MGIETSSGPPLAHLLHSQQVPEHPARSTSATLVLSGGALSCRYCTSPAQDATNAATIHATSRAYPLIRHRPRLVSSPPFSPSWRYGVGAAILRRRGYDPERMHQETWPATVSWIPGGNCVLEIRRIQHEVVRARHAPPPARQPLATYRSADLVPGRSSLVRKSLLTAVQLRPKGLDGPRGRDGSQGGRFLARPPRCRLRPRMGLHENLRLTLAARKVASEIALLSRPYDAVSTRRDG